MHQNLRNPSQGSQQPEKSGKMKIVRESPIKAEIFGKSQGIFEIFHPKKFKFLKSLEALKFE